jgi:hypothetical protein
MQPQLTFMLQCIIGLAAGAVIGTGFGILQDAARRRHEKLQESKGLKSGWSLIPGSGARVAYLLVALALIQLVCPLWFHEGVQWWVSGGVVAGYGYILFRQLRARIAGAK